MKSQLNRQLGLLYKEIAGRGPKSLKTFLIEDMIIIRFDWYKESIIKKLYKSRRGQEIVHNLYRELFLIYKNEIKGIVEEIVGIKVRNIYFDPYIKKATKDKFITILLKEKIN